MYIYLDESEDDNKFVVGGVVVNKDKDDLLKAIHKTRKFIKNKKGLSSTTKGKILNELKEYELHRNFKIIKRKFLENIIASEVIFISAFYNKNPKMKFGQIEKEEIYILCACEIVRILCENEDVYLLYDEFGKYDFKKKIEKCLMKNLKNIKLIKPCESQNIKEIQAADLVVGTIRRGLDGEDLENFNLLNPLLKLIQIKK